MAQPRQRGGGPVAHVILAWIAFFALYLLFTGTAQPAELAAGGICALLVASFEAALRHRSQPSLDLTLPKLRPLLPALGRLVIDTFRVGGVLLAAIWLTRSGRFCSIEIPTGSVVGSAAGWGIAVAAVSLPPNSFVVADGPQNGRLAIHQLVG